MAPRSPNLQTHTHTKKRVVLFQTANADMNRRQTKTKAGSRHSRFTHRLGRLRSLLWPVGAAVSVRPAPSNNVCVVLVVVVFAHRQMETDLRETRCLFDLPFPGVEQQGRLFQRYTLGFSARPLSLRASLFLFIYLFWCLIIERLIERIPTRRSLSSGSTQKPF